MTGESPRATKNNFGRRATPFKNTIGPPTPPGVFQRNRVAHVYTVPESIKKLKLIKFAPYDFKLELINIDALSARRRIACLFFMFDLLNNFTDAPALLSLICWSVPPRSLRGGRMFRVPYHRTSYGSFEPMNNMLTIMNEVQEIFDYHVNRSFFWPYFSKLLFFQSCSKLSPLYSD